MKIKNYIFRTAVACCMGLAFSACGDDDLDPDSIFPTDVVEIDPQSSTYQLDVYLDEAFRQTYNIQFRYKLQDVGTDMNYNLVPATYENSVDLAVLTKYLWFDVYDKVVPDKNFMKTNSPRIIHLIGSPAVNPANHTIVLGLAEGGLKVSLFYVNEMDVSSIDNLNEYYFITMHHEFAHILHQTKTYPKNFDSLSVGHYDALGWQDRDERVTASLGFVSNYASSQPREDFAETIARYITMRDAEWNALLENAAKGWELVGESYVETEDADGVDGVALINQKVEIARNWFRDAWGADLDALREEVQHVQNTYSLSVLEELRKQVYDIPVPGQSDNGETSVEQ